MWLQEIAATPVLWNQYRNGEKERNESKRIFIWIPENDQVNRDVLSQQVLV